MDEKQTTIVQHKHPSHSQELIGTPFKQVPLFFLCDEDTENKQEKVRHSYFIGWKLNSYRRSPEEGEEDEAVPSEQEVGRRGERQMP